MCLAGVQGGELSIFVPRAWGLGGRCNPLARRCCIGWCMGDSVLHCGAGFFGFVFVSVRGTCFVVGLLVLPLPGAGVSFFVCAKKVSKESSFVTARGHTHVGHSSPPGTALA